MRVEPLIPDAAGPPLQFGGDAAAFARAIDALGDVLAGATQAEDNFAYGRGTLQDAIYERAQADRCALRRNGDGAAHRAGRTIRA